MRTMPKQKPGKSKQDYETPKDLIAAIERTFGPIAFDLAANAKNTQKAVHYYSSRTDSLKQNWSLLQGNLWLNPPFADIEPWVKKCAETMASGSLVCPTRILLLTPASVGSNWFKDYVWHKATVYALNPRLTFVGETAPYPKDCILSCYGTVPGFEVWRWK